MGRINEELIRKKIMKAYRRKRILTMRQLRKKGMTTKQIFDAIKIGDIYSPRGDLRKSDTEVRRL